MKHGILFTFLLLSTPLCFGQPATNTNLSTAQIEGRALAQGILLEKVETNAALKGVLVIRNTEGKKTELPISLRVSALNSSTWTTSYSADIQTATNAISGESLVITHNRERANHYTLGFFTKSAVILASSVNYEGWPTQESFYTSHLSQKFAGSDFLVIDLGLEFFHWPEQKVLKHEMRRSRACKVLESTNPSTATNGYSRVVSWIDNESSGIVHAEAFDAQGKLLKEFDPKEFKKVNGQWQLQEMEIRNVQTKSRTRIEFDVAGEK